jgi:ribosomal-protein-serine acetyltransferase
MYRNSILEGIDRQTETRSILDKIIKIVKNPTMSSDLLLPVGDRYQLRLLQPSDAQELFALTNTNRTYLQQWLPWLNSIEQLDDTQKFIASTQQQFDRDLGFATAIWDLGTRENSCWHPIMLGLLGFNRIDRQNRIAYIGYWLAADCQGRGIMTAACRCLIDYAFSTMALNRIVIACASENKSSRAIPQRLGFTHEGTTRDAEWLYDRFVNHEIYALLQRDWYSHNKP